MKRTLSLILAALLLSSSIVACGKTEPKESSNPETFAPETTANDTNPPATNAPATELPETDAPAPSYDTSLITENGVAKAHIVVAEGADVNLNLAAEELVYHIKKVSGADVTVTNQAAEDSLPIIIATPDTHPELEELFPEDLAWLRETGEIGDKKRWGDDGFSIRMHDGKLYIFGAVSRGALNGVYDFIEENLGVLWLRAEEDMGLFYDEMPTITLEKTDYSLGHREKSPFALRGVSQYGSGGIPASEYPDLIRLYSRNKYNFAPTKGVIDSATIAVESGVGQQSIVSGHNIKYLLIASPLYDPNESEYWETNDEGVHSTFNSSNQVNIWSKKASDAIAASVIHSLDQAFATNPIYHVGICLEDQFMGRVYPEDTLPFEYAPGQFVNPEDEDYKSTVFFVFLNNIAKQVKEKYPDVYINTYAYGDPTIIPPRCELEDNIVAVFCHFDEELSQESMAVSTWDGSENTYKQFQRWLEKTPNLICYNYYGMTFVGGYYERPIWYRMQNDLQLYAENGLFGLTPALYYDVDMPFAFYNKDWGFNESDIWGMNMMTYWLYAKLTWNPYEDVDALIDYFCDKVYGEASDEMQEYYRLVKMGWDYGTELMADEFNVYHKWNTIPLRYFDYYLDVEVEGVHILDSIREALARAYEAADDTGKSYIQPVLEAFEGWEDFLTLVGII